MIFGGIGSQIDGAHWLVMTQGLLMLGFLLPALALLASRSTRRTRRRRPGLAVQRVVVRDTSPQARRDRDR